MKFLEKINVNSESKTYISGAIFFIIALFVVTAVTFLALISDKLDIVMTQPARETYTYFISIMDRILAILTLCVMLPLTIYQNTAQQKSKMDKSISVISLLFLLFLVMSFFSGEYYYLKKYQNGELSYSKMFCKPTIETKIFDNIIKQKGLIPPEMCLKILKH